MLFRSLLTLSGVATSVAFALCVLGEANCLRWLCRRHDLMVVPLGVVKGMVQEAEWCSKTCSAQVNSSYHEGKVAGLIQAVREIKECNPA